jgi:hypothetical protein
MAFDATVYAQLASVSPEAAAAYLASNPATPAAAPAPAPQPTFQAPQAQSQYAPTPQAQAQQPAPELARGTLEDFFNQPSAGNGGKTATSYFKDPAGAEKAEGSWLQFNVDRDITHADVSQMTEYGTNIPMTWKYGPMKDKPKFQLTIPGTAVASGDNDHPRLFEGGALRLYLKPGPVTDAFRAALQAGGESSGFPKGGSTLVMIKGGKKPNKTGNPTQLYEFRYTAPNGQAVSAQAEVAPEPVAAPVAPPVPAAPAVPEAPAVPAPVAAPAAPSDVDAEKAALLAKLQGLGG